MEIIFSNKLEMLYERLKNRLFVNSSPFTQRLVSLSCPMMRSWLSRRLADDPQVGISMGIEYSFHRQIIADLAQFSFHLPSAIELSLAIETEIKLLLQQGNPDLQVHFGENEEKGRKFERKLASLSHEIASLFQQYGIYGAHIINDWKQKEDASWQAKIWNKLFEEKNSSWIYPLKIAEKKLKINSTRPLELHLFGVSHISPLYHNILRSLATEIPVTYYLLSPTQNLWSDLVTDKQIGKLTDKANANQQEQLEEILRDRNPLLANMGKLGRKFLQEIEQEDFPTQEAYALADKVSAHPYYEELLILDDIETFTGRGTLLEHLHGDLLLLRTPQEKIDLAIDSSITIHSAHSIKREVEVLYDNILRRMHEDNIQPEQMIVMAPDINLYAAAINSVFGIGDNALQAQFYDLETLSQNRLAKGFYLLLDLAESRWDTLSFVQLLEHPDFQQGQKLKGDDLLQIRHWIEKTSIAWGIDIPHRQEILRRQHMSDVDEEISAVGTWKQGIGNLLDALALGEGHLSVEFSQASLLGRWIYWIENLRNDLKKLEINKPLNEWVHFLKELFEKYFPQKNFDDNSAEEHAEVIKILGLLYSKENTEEKYAWISIRTCLDKLLTRKDGTAAAKNLNAVTFCSLRPMRGVPAEALFLLGMDDNSFPRRKKNSPYNMFSLLSGPHQPPTPADEDRYLFLEAIMSTRSFLTISYTWDIDNKEKEPSIIVGEFIDYLDSAYTMNGKKITEAVLFHHPYKSYALEYYSDASPLKSYSLPNYHLAKSALLEKNVPLMIDISIFPKVSFNADREVDIKALSESFRNPIKTYLKKKHGVYLGRENENVLNVDEPFLLNSLDLHFWKKELLSSTTEEIVSKAYKEGKFPSGLFGKHAHEVVENHRQQQMQNLEALGIDAKTILSLNLSDHPSNAEEVVVPPVAIQIDDHQLIVAGKIEGISPQGLVLDAKMNIESLMKHWPMICLFYAVLEQIPCKVEPQVNFLRDHQTLNLKDNVDLLAMAKFFLLTEENLFLYIPEWIEAWLNDSTDKLNNSIDKSLKDPHTFFYNSEALWVWRDKPSPFVTPEQHKEGLLFLEIYFRFDRLLSEGKI